ncbi:glycoside hydrolase family 1 protein [Cellulosimicrobium arenosum]|uniref:beta-glucosidase n=1 Tax=Cellulosimicrobium arenosum TaxID=2708133 RepID=A0A927PG44_9MICO|nr:family 1 glycosylhydrolase [Cellulosimicrobium arenosum]MBD8080224.1 family 1 glycosylhydrolase [Cellulosimicrobium arenosum]
MSLFVPTAPLAPNPDTATGRVEMPQGFLWGTATAAYQVEGAARTDGRRDSIWDTFSTIPGAVINGDDGTDACDHYHRYREDVALMRDLHLGAYRFSTSWARVHPDGGAVNPAGLAFYDRLVDELLSADLLPWLTLYHWDLPQALEEAGGWTNRDTAYRFAEYAVTMHEALGDRVGVWTTLNEPWCSAFLGYTAGVHAPGRQSRPDGLAAAHHLMLAHGLGIQALRERAPAANLGLTLNFTVADPVDPADPADVDAARRIDGQFNRIFLDPILRGEYPADVLEDVAPYGLLDHVRDGDLDIISTPIDTLGVNYYNGGAVSALPQESGSGGGGTRPEGVREADDAAPVRETSSPHPAADGVHTHSRGLPLTDMGWEVQPEGLTRLLVRLQEEYTGPRGVAMYVTENGAAFPDVVGPDGAVDDQDRLSFIDGHLRATKDAIDAGADVRGYFAWSLLDNFEWALGYTKRFGIVRVDYETQERTVKSSGRWYATVARDNVIPARDDTTRP